MDDDKPIGPSVKIRVSAVISQEYEIDMRFFDIESDFGGRVPTKEEMIAKQAEYLKEDATSLWEGGEFSDIKVEEVK